MYTDRPDSSEQLERVALRLLRGARRHPVPLERLRKELARTVDPCRTAATLSALTDLVAEGTLIAFGDGVASEYFWAGNLDYLRERLYGIVEAHHSTYPYEQGISAGEIRKRFSDTHAPNTGGSIDVRLLQLAIAACQKEGIIVEADGGFRLSYFTPRARRADALGELEDHILRYVESRFCARVDTEEVSRLYHVDTRTAAATVARMVKSGQLIQLARTHPVREFRFLSPRVVEHAKAVLTSAWAGKAELSTSEIRIVLGQTRSTTIPLLEHLDRTGFTRRVGDFRRPAGADTREPVHHGAFDSERGL